MDESTDQSHLSSPSKSYPLPISRITTNGYKQEEIQPNSATSKNNVNHHLDPHFPHSTLISPERAQYAVASSSSVPANGDWSDPRATFTEASLSGHTSAQQHPYIYGYSNRPHIPKGSDSGPSRIQLPSIKIPSNPYSPAALPVQPTYSPAEAQYLGGSSEAHSPEKVPAGSGPSGYTGYNLRRTSGSSRHNQVQVPFSSASTSPYHLTQAPGHLLPIPNSSATALRFDLDERLIRSPHPPLTASYHHSHQQSGWPLVSSSSHQPIPSPSALLSPGYLSRGDSAQLGVRPYHSSPLLPDFPPIGSVTTPVTPLYNSTTSSPPLNSYPLPSAPPFLPSLASSLHSSGFLGSPSRTKKDSPVHIPPPLRFNYSASPPPSQHQLRTTLPSLPILTNSETYTMPPRKKVAGTSASGRPTPANSQSTSTTTNSARRKGNGQVKGNGWTMEQTYDSTGQRKEVIVIDDSESPSRASGAGVPRKRTRAQVAAAGTGGTAGSQVNGHSLNGSTSSIGVVGGTKKRKVDESSQASGSKKAKGKASGTAASNHHYAQPVPKQVQYPSQQSSSSTSHPPWDDPEGHYIVKPDDVIANKYKIIRLLGQGTFGKVVEARHIESRKKVAIKVIRAVQKYRDASKIEIRVLEALKKNDPSNYNKCIHLVEYFDFRNHPCLVSELYGMSVFDFLKQNSFMPFPEKHIQDFAKSLLRSVDFLHRLKLVHTDLKPENILLVSNEARLQGPRVKNAKSKSILRNTDIRLIDFGSATFENEYHSSVVSTRHYRAPEIILGLSWSYPCDLFSIGCILVEFFTGEALFQTHDNLEHLGMMEVVMGKIPSRIVDRARLKKPEFFKGNKIDYPNPQTSRSSRKYVKSLRSLSEIIVPKNPHNKLFLDLIVRLLDFDPDSRITVSQALRHPYCQMEVEPPA